MGKPHAYQRFFPSKFSAKFPVFIAALGFAAALFSVGLQVTPAFAQSSNSSQPADAPKGQQSGAKSAGAQKSDAQNPDDQNPAETLKVNVNVVGLFFNVKDKHGALIPNQTKDDFEVFEDGKPQIIKYFTAESNLPLTLGVLIDSSGSQ